MLIQMLMDFFSQGIAELVKLVPPLPPDVAAALSDVAEGMGWLEDRVFVLGVLVPWEAVDLVVNVWLSTFALWLGAIFTGIVLRIIRG